MSKVLGVSLFAFGFYVLTKSIIFGQNERPSVLPAILLSLGAIIIATHIIEEIGKHLMIKQLLALAIGCYLFLISCSISVIAIALAYHKDLELLMAHEIEVLWLLRDSSKIYRTIVAIIQNSLDCCKIHSLVRLVLNVLLFELLNDYNFRLITTLICQAPAA